jgi:xylulokinase
MAHAQVLFVGIDSGTQSTKVLLVDGESGHIVGSGAAPHSLIDGLPPGHLEQHPAGWFEAMEKALQQALSTSGARPEAIRGIGVSGQQHGFVPLDEKGEVIRPAKLWCDTSTAPQCARIIERVGGLERFIALTGNGLPPGFTASKIEWLREHEPANYARLRTVLLPHDYLNFRLTGAARMEPSDASGTALLDVRTRTWSDDVLKAIDPALRDKLPPLIRSDEPCGTVRADLAKRWGLREGVLVSAGGGDNMMSAIGTGNVRPGLVTVSLGTSGTIFAFSPTPVVDAQGEIAAFCDSTGGWLPLVCTMNVTVATELVRGMFGLSTEQLEAEASKASPGADGLLLVPYFEGERTPNVPSGTGVWFGANRQTHDAAHFARAAMEGATLGLEYGMRRMRALGIVPQEIRLTGGGSKAALWRQICADVFNAPVVCLEQSEAGALGAAMQACWCVQRQTDKSASIAALADAWVKTQGATRAEPRPAAVAAYERLYALHEQVATALRASFDAHRAMVGG